MMVDKVEQGLMLTELLQGYSFKSFADVSIQGVSSNSREIRQNDVFIALQGVSSHAIDYALEAVKLGAVAVLYDADDEYSQQRIALLQKQVNTLWIGVSNLQQNYGEIVSRFYGDPSQLLKIIGITGTDGKTSVTHLLTQALSRLDRKTGSIGTLGTGISNQLKSSIHTTPDAVNLQKNLYDFYQQGCEYVVMEVSSHALQQYRVSGCRIDIAVLTNLGSDHLDYHQTMENYAAAKARLFQQPQLKSRVLNQQDEFGRQLALEFDQGETIRYSSSLQKSQQNEAEVFLEQCDVTKKGRRLKVQTPVGDLIADTALMGWFNVDNILACIATLIKLGFDRNQIETAITDLQPIPGRMELLTFAKDQPQVVVDFAHTAQALGVSLSSAKEHCQGKLWCVFGCGGDRDQSKRPAMGQIAEQLADKLVITDDNPRTESAQNIVSGILEGIKQPELVSVIHSRQAAIEFALSKAAADDLVVIAGKGHEQVQIVGQERLPFSDKHVVKRAMGAL